MPEIMFTVEIPKISIFGCSELFPVHRIYCVGQNYAAHTLEMGGNPERDAPFFFSKPADAACQQKVVPWPPKTNNLHHEVELVIALGEAGHNLTLKQAKDSIFGFAVGVDLTRRDLQKIAKEKGRPWDTAKGFDCSAPISSIVKAEHWLFDDERAISLSVNGAIRQQATLNQLIWKIPELIKELSTYYNLVAGDLIFTGTPAGVGALTKGDKVIAKIDGIPELLFKLEQ